ncbi:aldehyde dehydrogenase (NAD+) [Mycolicibacterium sp. BK556]|uniref:aldehyde dehydrogenase family protein n=1 Tax=unclassified Mycolicibacterium TaxID=2636767 RepID=UPI00162059D8|nr:MULTISPECIES: aldehyde dehydrogenase family protein [unclassified Mycolicibacterium]MBB3602809.1 aldehyde dehydrogenase (NAD+) [Mycolicibacterium sp. BK556]MBB3633004.1 aldehyde dehydrogenase (NAD+) [Mycolicibacterium sp. BK607]
MTTTSTESTALNLRAAGRAETRMFIDGELRDAQSGKHFDNISPATGAVLGTASAAGPEDMTAAIAAARRAFDTTDWSTNHALRKRCLVQLQEALEKEAEDLREEIIAEVGAPLMTTLMAQVDWPLADALTFPTDLIDSFAWTRELGVGKAGDGQRRVVKEPVGVVAAIAPWNYPFEIVSNKLGQALATGNTVVLKPDPNTPWTSTRLGRIIAEHTDIPPGVVNVVPTPDNAVAELLVTDPRVDLISFTGSTDVGRRIAGRAAETLKRVFLELGGKSALVMLDDADLDAAIPQTAQVCFHAGQGCAVNSRLLVPAHRYDAVVARVIELFEMFKPGDPARADTLLGPVINPKQRDRILGFIDRAKAAGAQVLTGGTTPTDMHPELAGGNYVLPTLIAAVDNAAEIARQEVFGPVMVVLPYSDDAEALALANDSDYGLSGSVFTTSPDRGMEFANRVRAGSFSVNGGLFYGADAPYGGYKASGIGRQNGIEGFEQYLETKTIGYL